MITGVVVGAGGNNIPTVCLAARYLYLQNIALCSLLACRILQPNAV
jgi:hypothetical protein